MEERAERHFNLLDQTNIDFPAAVIQTEKRIENFFASKVGALKRLEILRRRWLVRRMGVYL